MVSDKMGLGVAGSVGNILPGTSAIPNKPDKASGPSGFEKTLDDAIKSQPKPESPALQDGVKFSQHALDRMASRGITFKPEEISKLNEAIDRAAKKGSKESLILMGDNALIVSIKNKTIVTAMDKDAMKENVFTNIDSTMIL